MLQRLYEQPVGAAVASLTTDIPPLTYADYETVSECIEVLAPFHLASTEMSTEKHVSASKVIPLIRMVQHKLAVKASAVTNPTALHLIKQLQHELHKRCTVENIRVLALATILDPRFKTLAFGNETHAQEAMSKLTAECAGAMRAERGMPSTSQVMYHLFHIIIVFSIPL